MSDPHPDSTPPPGTFEEITHTVVPAPRLHETDAASEARASRMTMRRTSQGKIVGHNQKMREVLAFVERIAKTNSNVLVHGESGTGKELVVAALHDASPRAHKPFVVINCGAISPDLVESELFGHEKGAFSGAVVKREGHIAAAEGGTLFLDEVGELPLALQVKLLRVLQNRQYTPVGSSVMQRCNVRFVAATNRNLEEEVRAGRFREDLYHRLNVATVHLPPLRERGADIEALALYFLQSSIARLECEGIGGFDPEALEAIKAWRWPGNVRELENAVERAVLHHVSGPHISLADLPQTVRDSYESTVNSLPPPRAREGGLRESLALSFEFPNEGLDLNATLEEVETRLIRYALERTHNNKTQAARLLRIGRTTLLELMRRRGIST